MGKFGQMRPFILFVGIILVFILFLRLPLISVPFFNPDEAINAIIGKTILNGGVMYRDAVDQKGPVTAFIYSLIFLIFGEYNMLAVHIALIFVILCISVALFLISRLIGDKQLSYWVALFFGLFSHTYGGIDMLAFSTEWLAILFGTIGVYFLLKYSYKNNYAFLFLSGFSFGVGVFSKQPVLLLFFVSLLFCGAFCHSEKKNGREMLSAIFAMILGFLAAVSLFISYFYLFNILKETWFWLWTYPARFYITAPSVSEKMKLAVSYFMGAFIRRNCLLHIFFSAGILITILKIKNSHKKITREILVDLYLVSLCIVSYIAIAFSGRYFEHYFIMVLPISCLVSAKAVRHLFNAGSFRDLFTRNKRLTKLYLSLTIIIIALGAFLSLLRNYQSVAVMASKIKKSDKQLKQVASYLKAHSSESDRIYLWGYCPQLYVYAERLPATTFDYLALVDVNFRSPAICAPFLNRFTACPPIYFVEAACKEADCLCYKARPLETFPELIVFLNEAYAIEKVFLDENREPAFKLHIRKNAKDS